MLKYQQRLFQEQNIREISWQGFNLCSILSIIGHSQLLSNCRANTVPTCILAVSQQLFIPASLTLVYNVTTRTTLPSLFYLILSHLTLPTKSPHGCTLPIFSFVLWQPLKQNFRIRKFSLGSYSPKTISIKLGFQTLNWNTMYFKSKWPPQKRKSRSILKVNLYFIYYSKRIGGFLSLPCPASSYLAYLCFIQFTNPYLSLYTYHYK